ncbi:Uncharacterized protein FKW44_007705, partial [Caligus rogercresseyi]
SILERKAYTKSHKNLGALKASLEVAWAKIDPNVIRTACQSFKKRLIGVVVAKGGYIE